MEEKRSFIKKNVVYIILFVIIALQLSRIIYVFGVEKEGWHSDEIWSYGLANSYYQPYIYMDDGGNPINMDKWLDSKVLRDYITVQKEERFVYGSVLSNLKKDMHPPLYFMVLHTICSFFPDSYSKWYGFSINIVCFIITQLYLFFLCVKMLKSKWKSLLVVVLFGFTTAGVNVFIYVRNYAMAAMFMTGLLYYHISLFQSKEKSEKRKALIGCMFFSMCAMLTVYVNVVVIFVLALLTCLYFWMSKNKSDFFKYGISMLASIIPVITMSGLFRVMFNVSGINVNQGEESISKAATTSRLIDYRVTFNCILYDFTGFKITVESKYMLIDFIKILLPVWVLLIALFIYLEIKKHLISSFIVKVFKKIKNIVKKNREGTILLIFTFLMILTNFIVVVYMVNQVIMVWHTDRYLFPVFPAIAVFLVLILLMFSCLLTIIITKCFSLLLKCDFENKWFHIPVVCLVIVVFFAVHFSKASSGYLFERNHGQESIEEIVKGKKVALLLSDDWLLTCYTDLLFESDKVFVGKFGNGNDALLAKLKNTKVKPDYIIVDVTLLMLDMKIQKEKLIQGIDDEEIKKVESVYSPQLKEYYGADNIEIVGTDTIFSRNVIIYMIETPEIAS